MGSAVPTTRTCCARPRPPSPRTSPSGRGYRLITSGRKAEAYFRYRDYDIEAAFGGFSDAPTYEDARGIGQAATRSFLAEETDLVEIIYTRFVSAGMQVVERQTLVPLARDEVDAGEQDGPVAASYEFEPSPDTILDLLLPRYVESRASTPRSSTRRRRSTRRANAR